MTSEGVAIPYRNDETKYKFVCDSCGSGTNVIKKCRGMKLCPECREMARDYFGR